jgi:hypothetical protein
MAPPATEPVICPTVSKNLVDGHPSGTLLATGNPWNMDSE